MMCIKLDSHRWSCRFYGSWVTMRVSFEMQCVDS